MGHVEGGMCAATSDKRESSQVSNHKSENQNEETTSSPIQAQKYYIRNKD
jgi:hypothetical protein